MGASKIARDITERKHTEEEIRQQAALLDLAPAVVRSMDDRIILWTRGAEQLYGFTQKEALGRISHELLRTEFPLPLVDIQKTLKTVGVWEGELEHRTRDGKRVVGQVSGCCTATLMGSPFEFWKSMRILPP